MIYVVKTLMGDRRAFPCHPAPILSIPDAEVMFFPCLSTPLERASVKERQRSEMQNPNTSFRTETVAALVEWAATNPGLAKLLDTWCAAGVGAPRALRLATAQVADLRAYVRLHDLGPEVELLRIIDAPGGFRVFGSNPVPGSRGVLPVIASEVATVAAIHALEKALRSIGVTVQAPSPLSPASFTGLPLQRSAPTPILLSIGPGTGEEMVSAAEAETISGARRESPEFYATDLEHDGLPVYDVRLSPSALSAAIMSSHSLGAWRGKPILVRQRAVGGAEFWLLIDGADEGEAILGFVNQTWGGGGSGREGWPSAGTQWLPAPVHMLRPRILN